MKPGPRIGIAYAANDRAVVRGGYRIFWAPAPFGLQNALGYSQNTSINASLNNFFTQT